MSKSNKPKLEPGVQFISAEDFCTAALAAYAASVHACTPPPGDESRAQWSSPQDFAYELIYGVAERVVRTAQCGGVSDLAIAIDGVGQARDFHIAQDGTAVMAGCGVS